MVVLYYNATYKGSYSHRRITESIQNHSIRKEPARPYSIRCPSHMQVFLKPKPSVDPNIRESLMFLGFVSTVVFGSKTALD